jgi:Fe-S oxidoreductase
MGEMVESFRAATGPDRPAASPSRWGRWLFREILPHRGRIAALSDLLELYQRSGLRDLVGRALPRVSARLTRLHSMQPDVPLRAARRIETDRRHAAFPAEGERRARVALFLGCVGSEWFAPVHRATIRVLTRNGCEVVVPHAQTCCGALHRHAGVLGDAAKLLAKNRSVFAEAGVDAVIVNAAGCGASLKEPLAGVEEGPPSYQDVCEFLGELDIHPPERALPAKVAYDQPCHLLHGQGIGGDVVERLLRLVPELELSRSSPRRPRRSETAAPRSSRPGIRDAPCRSRTDCGEPRSRCCTRWRFSPGRIQIATDWNRALTPRGGQPRRGTSL